MTLSALGRWGVVHKVWVRGERRERDRRRRRLLLSALQSAVFNRALELRAESGDLAQVRLGDVLQKYGIANLLVCGVTTEVCVNTTVREANDRGYRCVVLADGCASYFPEFHDMGLKMIKAQGGIFGWVSDSAAVLEAMTVETSNNLAAGASR